MSSAVLFSLTGTPLKAVTAIKERKMQTDFNQKNLRAIILRKMSMESRIDVWIDKAVVTAATRGETACR